MRLSGIAGAIVFSRNQRSFSIATRDRFQSESVIAFDRNMPYVSQTTCIDGGSKLKMRKSIVCCAATLLFAAAYASNVSAQQEPPVGPRASPQPQTSVAEIEQVLARDPLKPADTSSPRATLRSFLDAMSGSHRLLMEAHRLNTTDRDSAAPGEVEEKARAAERLFERAVSCLDLSEVSVAYRREIGYETALQLKEIFDRIELPAFDSIPDAEAVEREKEEEQAWELVKWRVSGTDITIAEVDMGPREGEFLFTPRTVGRVAEFYARVEALPYKAGTMTSEGFFDFYVSTPGRLLPPRWSEALPEWASHRFLQQTVWQWFALGVAMVLGALAVAATYSRLLRRATDLTQAKLMWRRSFFCLSPVAAIMALAYVGTQVNITGAVLMGSRTVLGPVAWFHLACAVLFAARAVAEMIIESPNIDPEGVRASYLRASFSIVGFAAAGTILVFGLARVGVALAPMLAGVGIGGLAIALAARPTLESIIGSFTIFADSPYQVGQRVKVMGHEGTVEAIGLRSTRIRLSSGHVTSIPNEKMAAVDVENVGSRPFIRRTFDVTITYDTPPEKIERAVEILREILSAPQIPGEEPHRNDPINQPDFPPRVYFNDLNPDSLNIYVSYWYHPGAYWDYMEHAHDVNLQIMKRFNAEGIEFAFPTQTLHLAGNDDRRSGTS